MISGVGNQDYLILFGMNLVCSWSCCEAVLAIYAGLLGVYVAQFARSEYFPKTETTKFANLCSPYFCLFRHILSIFIGI